MSRRVRVRKLQCSWLVDRFACFLKRLGCLYSHISFFCNKKNCLMFGQIRFRWHHLKPLTWIIIDQRHIKTPKSNQIHQVVVQKTHFYQGECIWKCEFSLISMHFHCFPMENHWIRSPISIGDVRVVALHSAWVDDHAWALLISRVGYNARDVFESEHFTLIR